MILITTVHHSVADIIYFLMKFHVVLSFCYLSEQKALQKDAVQQVDINNNILITVNEWKINVNENVTQNKNYKK